MLALSAYNSKISSSTLHLQAQPHCMSPMVVFKYKATPVSVNGSTILGSEQEEGSDQDDEQGKVILLKGWGDCLILWLIIAPVSSWILKWLQELGPIQTSYFCSVLNLMLLLVTEFDISTAKKNNSDSDILPESYQIQDLPKPRDNFPSNSLQDCNPASEFCLAW